VGWFMLRTPRGGAGTGTATADDRLLSIGAVLNDLREEFPEVSISKIRFLEAEGLVEPQRTPSGYRKFTVRDVERLGHVLRMQRDHYLPLKVIREHLDAFDRGEPLPLPTSSSGESRELIEVGTGEHEPPAVLRIAREELLAATGADAGVRPGGGWS
jgi:DNA-binding transcriptional MerR regulator